jgi:dihydroorotate dehydrogenase
MIEALALRLLYRLNPETAHDLALGALRRGLVPMAPMPDLPRLQTALFGHALPNPIGLAAGFDKNAVAIGPCLKAGFGHVEVGAVTPRPQPGNPRPRLFRLPRDGGVINRFGFNNAGLAAMQQRLAAPRPAGLVGVNIGANKDSADRQADYVTLIEGLAGLADYVSINVSSPNTPGLRGLQDRDALDALLGACAAVATMPLVVKIAPDLDDSALADIAALAGRHQLAGIVATNTTLSREGLTDPARGEAGGLSGRPLRARALGVLRDLRRETGGQLTLIGVGGIDSAESAYERIRAGASAVQLYSGLVYGGLGLVRRICVGLDALLARDGFASVAEAVGADALSASGSAAAAG